jgi:uncharacterized membrane protein YqgA involved in biofilm formation
MTGTLINVVAVIVAGVAGTFLGSRMPKRIRETIMHGLGLITIVIGLHLSLETDNVLIVLGALLVGGIVGEVLHIERRIDSLGLWLERRTAGRGATAGADERPATAPGASEPQSSRFSHAFLTASLVYCVGPLTVLGSIQDGLTGDYSLLAIKSTLDFFAGLAFASTLGPGVIAAALTVLVYQGALSLGAGWASNTLTDPMIAEMTAAGGVLMLALGLGLLEVKRIRTGNLLPAIVIAPLIVAILAWLGS